VPKGYDYITLINGSEHNAKALPNNSKLLITFGNSQAVRYFEPSAAYSCFVYITQLPFLYTILKQNYFPVLKKCAVYKLLHLYSTKKKH
jgi:hypothetical protein